MQERKLRILFGQIVVLLAPIPIGITACGGVVERAEGMGGGPEAGGLSQSATGGTGEPQGGSGGAGVTQGGSGGSAPNCVGRAAQGAAPSGPCFQPSTVQVPAACLDTELTAARCRMLCGSSYSLGSCSVISPSDANTVTILCPPTCVSGRRPTGFTEPALPGSDVGAHFARAAALEAASVDAFRYLRADLREYGAPRSLLRALSRAAQDERRHSRTTRALARRRGACAVPPHVPPRTPRSLEAIALENGVEGCVRELYGALVATFQAHRAADPEVRGVMRRIAREETRHAALSLRVQRWLEGRLDRAARQRVAAERHSASTRLARELELPFATSIAEPAGLPSVAEARALYDSLSPLLG